MTPEKSVALEVPNVVDMQLMVGFNESEITTLRKEAMLLAGVVTIISLLGALAGGVFAFRRFVGKTGGYPALSGRKY